MVNCAISSLDRIWFNFGKGYRKKGTEKSERNLFGFFPIFKFSLSILDIFKMSRMQKCLNNFVKRLCKLRAPLQYGGC